MKDGYRLDFDPPDMPAFVVVEALFGVLEDLKQQFETAPTLSR
jgi:hypothetical protein